MVKRAAAGLVLILAAVIAVKLAIGLIAAAFWTILAIAVLVAVLWAIKQLVW